MTIALPLEKMSLSEKIQTMELLWDSICHEGEISSPAWHQAVLMKRESSEQNFEDWSEVKSDIRKKSARK